MEFFHHAKAVRLKNSHGKYLTAEEDEESVTQGRSGSSKAAKWTVEFVENSDDIIRLKSCYGKYLTASNQPFLLGMTGRKVLQTLPKRLDSSVEWEPVKERGAVKLKTRYGQYLRANGGLPPWRNSVTHDTEWVLWEVHVVEIVVAQSPTGKTPPPPPVMVKEDSFSSAQLPTRKTPPPTLPQPPPPVMVKEDSFSSAQSTSPARSQSSHSSSFSRQESIDSLVSSPPKGGSSRRVSPPKGSNGRIIYFHIANEDGKYDEGFEELSITFKGNGLNELKSKLEVELGIYGITLCARSPLNNGKLYPLRLQLPPNNVDMHVVVVPPSSQEGEDSE
ncbi:hypothetical protein ABFS82_12G108700 [Erythranthe guttata]|uniref:Uncharacterized protein n=1 Tax=Erythranthe guttata TaxID=4155 RepID=A0A022QL53_ERYGU|nr:PREDICTED: uncharacterized protein LOC105967464 [Erythranthe guttata]EYU28686.1 hypothetical protein MIMGU_mgv1a009779mg [Erythranthe guttata]|eukprot:XP_012847515.1 PREDICTED: uncharacterized protein LOC105967464 [Erythranthe guttata]